MKISPPYLGTSLSQLASREYWIAYGRLWECVLATMAGALEGFTVNEARECLVRLPSCEPVFADVRTEMLERFEIDLDHCFPPGRSRERAMEIARQVLASDWSELQVELRTRP